MRAMVLHRLCDLDENDTPLKFMNLPDPVLGADEVLIQVAACGVCHTELDEIEGRTPPPHLPIILGHQVVGKVVMTMGQSKFHVGDRVGVGWIYSACGGCRFCREGNENLCPNFKATGRDAHGGYAQYMRVPEAFAFPLPDVFSDVEAAPLLCAGAVGYRSLRLTRLQDGDTLGLFGFGASGHLVMQLARFQYPRSPIFVFSPSQKERALAQDLGATWTGDLTEEPLTRLDAIIDTTPVWMSVVEALKNLDRGGRLVVNAIRKLDTDKNYLNSLDYAAHLWLEREIKTVANVTRADIAEFLKIAARIPIHPEVQEFGLEDANQALRELKARKIRGAKVLRIS